MILVYTLCMASRTPTVNAVPHAAPIQTARGDFLDVDDKQQGELVETPLRPRRIEGEIA
jgi:hypothetical protein